MSRGLEGTPISPKSLKALLFCSGSALSATGHVCPGSGLLSGRKSVTETLKTGGHRTVQVPTLVLSWSFGVDSYRTCFFISHTTLPTSSHHGIPGRFPFRAGKQSFQDPVPGHLASQQTCRAKQQVEKVHHCCICRRIYPPGVWSREKETKLRGYML